MMTIVRMLSLQSLNSVGIININYVCGLVTCEIQTVFIRLYFILKEIGSIIRLILYTKQTTFNQYIPMTDLMLDPLERYFHHRGFGWNG